MPSLPYPSPTQLPFSSVPVRLSPYVRDGSHLCIFSYNKQLSTFPLEFSDQLWYLLPHPSISDLYALRNHRFPRFYMRVHEKSGRVYVTDREETSEELCYWKLEKVNDVDGSWYTVGMMGRCLGMRKDSGHVEMMERSGERAWWKVDMGVKGELKKIVMWEVGKGEEVSKQLKMKKGVWGKPGKNVGELVEKWCEEEMTDDQVKKEMKEMVEKEEKGREKCIVFKKKAQQQIKVEQWVLNAHGQYGKWQVCAGYRALYRY